MIRFIDEYILNSIEWTLRNDDRLSLSDTATCLAYLDGMVRGRDLDTFLDFVVDRLGLGQYRYQVRLFHEVFSRVDEPKQTLISLIDEFRNLRPWCVACGRDIKMDDDYIGGSGENGSVFHKACVRSADFPAENWDHCALCRQILNRTALKIDLKKLNSNVNDETRLPYDDIGWRKLEINEDREFAWFSRLIPQDLPIVQRMYKFKELLPRPDPELFSEFEFEQDPKQIRRYFEPLHCGCRNGS